MRNKKVQNFFSIDINHNLMFCVLVRVENNIETKNLKDFIEEPVALLSLDNFLSEEEVTNIKAEKELKVNIYHQILNTKVIYSF